MARLPWAKGNLLIALTPNDIIKQVGPCVRPHPVSLSRERETARIRLERGKIASETEDQR